YALQCRLRGLRFELWYVSFWKNLHRWSHAPRWNENQNPECGFHGNRVSVRRGSSILQAGVQIRPRPPHTGAVLRQNPARYEPNGEPEHLAPRDRKRYPRRRSRRGNDKRTSSARPRISTGPSNAEPRSERMDLLRNDGIRRSRPIPRRQDS